MFVCVRAKRYVRLKDLLRACGRGRFLRPGFRRNIEIRPFTEHNDAAVYSYTTCTHADHTVNIKHHKETQLLRI